MATLFHSFAVSGSCELENSKSQALMDSYGELIIFQLSLVRFGVRFGVREHPFILTGESSWSEFFMIECNHFGFRRTDFDKPFFPY